MVVKINNSANFTFRISQLLTGISKTAGLLMPATWSFDKMKCFSTLDTLEEEGAKLNGENKGQGLYKFIETENDKIIAGAKRDLTDN